MARYGQQFKTKVVARLLPPESAAASEVSGQVGVSKRRWSVGSETESFSDFDCGNFSADNGRTFISRRRGLIARAAFGGTARVHCLVAATLGLSRPLMRPWQPLRMGFCAPSDELRRQHGHAQQVVCQHEQPTTDLILASPRTGIRSGPRRRTRASTARVGIGRG